MTANGVDILGSRAYALICAHDGITARELARQLGATRREVNQLLYRYPFIHDLCYHDDEYRWYGLIHQGFPHEGLADYCGWYGDVSDFLALDEEAWLQQLVEGCGRIGRNVNDTRGVIHSFTDARLVMRGLFADLKEFGAECDDWELAFEVRIKRAKWVRIYADVLVVVPEAGYAPSPDPRQGFAFSLEFKMKDAVDPEEVAQAAKYAPYLGVVLGADFRVIPALVLTRASDLFCRERDPRTKAPVAVASGDMLFNVFDEHLGLLG